MPHIAREITRWGEKEIAPFLKRTRTVCRQSGISIRIAPQSGGLGRVLIITPAKAGNAVGRNRIRRQIKALFYERKLYEKGLDWVFYINNVGMNTHTILNNIVDICLKKVLPES